MESFSLGLFSQLKEIKRYIGQQWKWRYKSICLLLLLLLLLLLSFGIISLLLSCYYLTILEVRACPNQFFFF